MLLTAVAILCALAFGLLAYAIIAHSLMICPSPHEMDEVEEEEERELERNRIDPTPEEAHSLRHLSEQLSEAKTNKDEDLVLSFYAYDAKIYPPGMPAIEGKESVKANLRSTWANNPSSQPSTLLEIGQSGDIGFTVGLTNTRDRNGGLDVTRRFVTIWQLKSIEGEGGGGGEVSGGGRWKIIHDIYNSTYIREQDRGDK